MSEVLQTLEGKIEPVELVRCADASQGARDDEPARDGAPVLRDEQRRRDDGHLRNTLSRAGEGHRPQHTG